MATVITILGTVPNESEYREIYNITITDASTAIELLSANSDRRYGIKSIDVCGQFAGTEWFKVLDGDNILIGPRILNSGIPWPLRFEETVYGTRGNALKFQTKSAFNVSLVMEVLIGVPHPSSSISPSASPSS